MGELVDLGVQYDVVQKSGSWYSFNEDKLGQGRDAVKQLLLDNPELAETIEMKVKQIVLGGEVIQKAEV